MFAETVSARTMGLGAETANGGGTLLGVTKGNLFLSIAVSVEGGNYLPTSGAKH